MAALTGRKCSRKSTADEEDDLVSSQTSVLKNMCQIPLQKAVSVHYANVFTAPFLCLRRFPAAPSQLKTPARPKNHVPGRYCGKTHWLRPSQTTCSHKSWPERHVQWEEQRHGVCKSRAAHENTMKNISKTKGSVGFIRSEQLRQKNVSGKHKEIYLGKQKNVGVNSKEIAALNKIKPLDKAWN